MNSTISLYHYVGDCWSGLPAGCRKALEAMSAELNGADPSFTIRRNMQHALEDRVVVEELKKVSLMSFITPPAATAV